MDRQRTSGGADVVERARATEHETWKMVMVGKTANGATLAIGEGCVVGRHVRAVAGTERVWEWGGDGLRFEFGCEDAVLR